MNTRVCMRARVCVCVCVCVCVTSSYSYTATFCREFLFNTALLGTPSLARYLKETYNPRGQAVSEGACVWVRGWC